MSAMERLTLAHEILVAGILRDLKLEEPGLARAWAAFWLSLDGQDADIAEAIRRLAELLAADPERQLAPVVQVHQALAQVELEQAIASAEGGAARLVAFAVEQRRRDRRLADLLAALEGALVSRRMIETGPAPSQGRAVDELLAQLSQLGRQAGLLVGAPEAGARPAPAKRRAA